MMRPITTLFMLSSVDGKISTGATDTLDVDRDFPRIAGLHEGLHQYYEIEQTTDLWSFNSGRVQAKMGVNEKPLPEKSPVSFVLVDNHHLTEAGVRYFSALSQTFVLITTNENHPAFRVMADNLDILYQKSLSLSDALTYLATRHGCERLTVQSGGTLNAILAREGLLDFVDIVMAPVLIGGRDTSSIIDGPSFTDESELSSLGILRLLSADPLEDSYLRLRYEVVHSEKTTVE